MTAVINPMLAIGMQNKNIIDQVAAAYGAALKLAEDGYTVLDITIGHGRPLITIEACDGCRHLNGVETTSSNVSACRYMISHALYGCLVQWSGDGEQP